MATARRRCIPPYGMNSHLHIQSLRNWLVAAMKAAEKRWLKNYLILTTRNYLLAQSKQEWNRGEFKQTEFFKLVLEHYEGLPLIEQVQAPANYESRLKHLIEMDYNFVTGEPGKNANPLNNLFDLLLPRNIPMGSNATTAGKAE